MTIKSDKWIKEMSEKHEMIKPFRINIQPVRLELIKITKNLFPMAHLPTVMMLDVQTSLRFLPTFILLQLIQKDLMKIALSIYKVINVKEMSEKHEMIKPFEPGYSK